MGLTTACGWLATICLTIYPAVAIGRMVRRRSSLDYSLPGLVLVVIGLAAYLVTVWESPGWLTGTISLGWNVVMLVTATTLRLMDSQYRLTWKVWWRIRWLRLGLFPYWFGRPEVFCGQTGCEECKQPLDEA